MGKEGRNRGVLHREVFLGSRLFLVLLWNTWSHSLAGLRYYSSHTTEGRQGRWELLGVPFTGRGLLILPSYFITAQGQAGPGILYLSMGSVCVGGEMVGFHGAKRTAGGRVVEGSLGQRGKSQNSDPALTPTGEARKGFAMPCQAVLPIVGREQSTPAWPL